MNSYLLSDLGAVDRNSTASSSEGDDETQLLNNIMGDIRCGFIQKKSYGDTAFTAKVTKVKKVCVSQLTQSCTRRRSGRVLSWFCYFQVTLSEPTSLKPDSSESQTTSKLKGFEFLDQSSVPLQTTEQNNNIPEVS